jgi:hypothetical protein
MGRLSKRRPTDAPEKAELIAWPPFRSFPGGAREEKLSADE